jgi:hypothetical protein
MQKHKFAPMLGPASKYPEGSPEWAECMGNELDYVTETAVDVGVERLLGMVRQAMAGEPWLVWPDPPCQTPDGYFELCTGLTYARLWLLIDTYIPRHGLTSPERYSEDIAKRIADSDDQFTAKR